MQDRYLAKINDMFGKDVRAWVPEMERDVTGLPMIERLASIMYGDEELMVSSGRSAAQGGVK
jgi:arsenite-transporting ATPase